MKHFADISKVIITIYEPLSLIHIKFNGPSLTCCVRIDRNINDIIADFSINVDDRHFCFSAES